MTSVLLLADGPVQVSLMARLATLLRQSGIESKIVLVDYFTYLYGKDFLDSTVDQTGIEMITTEELFKSWQSKGKPNMPLDLSEFFQNWQNRYTQSRDIDSLLRTDIYTNSFERTFTYLPIDKDWVLKSHYDILHWCESIILSEMPRLLVSINSNLLPTNVFFEMSRKLEIVMITFVDSRIQNRWVPRYDAGYGMSSDLQKYILGSEYVYANNREVEQFIESFKFKKSGSYKSLAESMIRSSERFEGHILRYLQRLLSELLSWMKYSIKALINGPGSRGFKVRRFDQSFPRVCLSEFKRRIFPFAIRFDSRFQKKFDGTDYFYWALHDRPEMSGLVLGDGRDEVEYLLKFADILPSDTHVVVKETPLIFGLRSKGFYKHISGHPRVILANPYMSSKPLIQNAKGVVGMSGTVLLEAAILSTPSWALGKPEFLPVLYGNGWDGLPEFVKKSIAGVDEDDLLAQKLRLRKYLKFIFDNSTSGDSSLSNTDEPADMEYDLQRMTREILKHFQD